MNVWENLNNFNLIIGVINGVWGIGNIFVTIFNYILKKKKDEFKDLIENERKSALEERNKLCRNCRKDFKAHIKSIETLAKQEVN